nr:right-handed parallel beta-helix repeat-containing protein [Bacteroidota bacterium]
SATNTLTINGNGNTLSFAPVTGQRYVMLLNGAKHVIIDNLNITTTSATFGYGIQFMNEADNSIVRNCTINTSAVTSTTAASSGGIVGSGSLTSNITAGFPGNNVLIENNVLLGGTSGGSVYGIIYYGSTAAPQQNLIIRNNIVRDNHGGGIRVSNCDFVTIEGNEVSRPNKNSSTTFEGIYILGTKSEGSIVRNNKVHSTSANMPTNASIIYPLYNAAAGSAAFPMLFYNNLVYNIGGTGTQYGYFNNANFVKFYYNTIVLDNQTATTGITRCIHHTGLANTSVDIINNLFVNTRSGSTTKYGIFLNSGAITNGIINNNSFHISPTTAIGAIGFLTTDQTTLANWQTASGNDINSIVANPQFTSATNLMPLNVALKAGIPIAVKNDFNGVLRSNTAPTFGAYEMAAPTDLAAHGIVASSFSICSSINEPVIAKISNYGKQAIDFSVNPATVTVNITGAATQTLTYIVNNNNLSGNNPLGIGASIDIPMGSLNMSTAGTYSFVVTVSIAGDGDSSNDISPMESIVVNPATAISTQPVSTVLCEGSTATFTVVATGGSLTYQWKKAGVNLSGETTSVLTLNNISVADEDSYSVEITGTCGNETSSSATLTVTSPTLITAQPVGATQCEGTNASFTVAATGSNLTYQWNDGTGIIPGATSTTLTLNNLSVADAGNYTVDVSGTCGTITSSVATLAVNPDLTPSVIINASSTSACGGQAITFIASAVNPGANPVYQWFLNNTQVGINSDTYILNNSAGNDQIYVVMTTDIAPCQNYQSATSPVITLSNSTVTPSVTIAASQTAICPGDVVSFTTTGSNTGSSPTYTWKVNGNIVSYGATYITNSLNHNDVVNVEMV